MEKVEVYEQSVIGAIMLDSNLFALAASKLESEDFKSEAARTVFEAALKLNGSGWQVDTVTIISALPVEYKDYILSCAQSTPSLSNISAYINLILRESKRRRLDALFIGASIELREGDVDEVEAKVREGMNYSKGDIKLYKSDSAEKTIQDIWENKDKKGITTGFPKLDYVIGSFKKGNLYILAGRSGIGKSAVAIRMMIKSGVKALYVSLEMSLGQLNTRIVSQVTRISHKKIEDATCSPEERHMIDIANKELKSKSYIMTDKAGLSLRQIRGLIQTERPDIVFIDHLGLIRATKAESRRVEIDTLANSLKETAKDFDIPVVALCQLKRVENGAKEDKRPCLSDLRESGAIEQAADVVMLVHRPGHFNLEGNQNESQLIIAKNRQGENGMIRMYWEGSTMTYTELEDRRAGT